MTQRKGSITLRGNRYRVRQRVGDGKRIDLGSFATREEAERASQAFLDVLGGDVLAAGGEGAALTVADMVRAFMVRREASGQVRGIRQEKSRVKKIYRAHFAEWDVSALDFTDIEDWVAELLEGVGWQSTKHSFGLLRLAYKDAVRRRIVETTPCAAVVFPKKSGDLDPRWTFLTEDEIETILVASNAIPTVTLCAIAASIFTGLRRGELCALRWSDVELDGEAPHLWVRRSVGGMPPKNGKPRRVPLLPAASLWLSRWAAETPSDQDGEGALVFPANGSRSGTREHRHDYAFGWYDKPWRDGSGTLRITPGMKSRAGVPRAVRWHDLRHTFASHLIMGTWGRRWSLEEVRDVLGHSSKSTTERYAHLAPQHLDRAAAETAAGWDQGWDQNDPTPRDHSEEGGSSKPTVGSSSLPGGATEKHRDSIGLHVVPRGASSDDWSHVGPTLIARQLLASIAAGDPDVVALAIRLAGAVLGAEGTADVLGEVDHG